MAEPEQPTDEPERDPRERDDAFMVDWVRLDASKRLMRFLTFGAIGMTMGSLVVATALVYARVDPHHPIHSRAIRSPAADGFMRRPLLLGAGAQAHQAALNRSLAVESIVGLIGLALLLAGGLYAVIGLQVQLARESYLAMRSDGLLLTHPKRRLFVPWDDLLEARAEGPHLVLELRDGTEHAIDDRFASVTHAELAKRIGKVRQRALFGLLAS